MSGPKRKGKKPPRFKVGDTGYLRFGDKYKVLAITELESVEYVICKKIPKDSGAETIAIYNISSPDLMNPIRNAVLYVNVWKGFDGTYDFPIYDTAEQACTDAQKEWEDYREDDGWAPIAIAFEVTVPDHGSVPIYKRGVD